MDDRLSIFLAKAVHRLRICGYRNLLLCVPQIVALDVLYEHQFGCVFCGIETASIIEYGCIPKYSLLGQKWLSCRNSKNECKSVDILNEGFMCLSKLSIKCRKGLPLGLRLDESLRV